MNILIIDGQGGGLGKQLTEAVKRKFPGEKITAVGQIPQPPRQCSKQARITPQRAKTP